MGTGPKICGWFLWYLPSALYVKLHECQFERNGIILRTNTFSLQEYRYKSTVTGIGGPRFPVWLCSKEMDYLPGLGNICWTSTKMYACILSEVDHLLFVFTVAQTIIIITWQHYEKTLDDKLSSDILLMKLVSEGTAFISTILIFTKCQFFFF